MMTFVLFHRHKDGSTTAEWKGGINDYTPMSGHFARDLGFDGMPDTVNLCGYTLRKIEDESYWDSALYMRDEGFWRTARVLNRLKRVNWYVLGFLNRVGLAGTPDGQMMSWRDVGKKRP